MPVHMPPTMAEREAELAALQSAFDKCIASSRELEEELDTELAKMRQYFVGCPPDYGLPSAPKCGFSQQLIELLDLKDVTYDAFDILQDEEVQQGLKTFSNWPTYPQLYAKGEPVGGLDIVKELQESGELMDMLK